MNLSEIKKAVDQGRAVCWGNPNYRVIKDSLGQYLIKCGVSGHCIGLTHRDGTTMNGDPDDFYTLGD